MRLLVSTFLIATGSASLAEQSRELDSHEHGVGTLNIAFDGDVVAMEFFAPGADIVGFEHTPESAEDRAAVDGAVATLSRPLNLFVLPQEAGCSVIEASAELETGLDDHGHDDHDHAEDHAHDDHAHDKDDHGHDDHAHEDHADEAGHAEFHAEYLLNCSDPSALDTITFAYFDMFANALELEVQIVTTTGARAFEVERGNPSLDLRGQL